jgi:hypothetical protein
MKERKYTIKEIESVFNLSHPVSSFEEENKRHKHFKELKRLLEDLK